MNGNMDILYLVFDIGSENNITEPLFKRANDVEGLTEKGVAEDELAHTLFIFFVRSKLSEEDLSMLLKI